eukprot:647201-Rhodomonas_salina.1
MSSHRSASCLWPSLPRACGSAGATRRRDKSPWSVLRYRRVLCPVRYCAVRVWSYAVCGTDIAYGAPHRPPASPHAAYQIPHRANNGTLGNGTLPNGTLPNGTSGYRGHAQPHWGTPQQPTHNPGLQVMWYCASGTGMAWWCDARYCDGVWRGRRAVLR